jgi:glycerol kinase
VVRPRVAETTALGAAYLAGLAVGFWKNIAEIGSQWQQDRRFTASLKAPARNDLQAKWSKALGRAKAWA